jgi:hypothetical protein
VGGVNGVNGVNVLNVADSIFVTAEFMHLPRRVCMHGAAPQEVILSCWPPIALGNSMCFPHIKLRCNRRLI